MTTNEICDPVIDEIRAVRHKISAKFNHDPASLIEHYLEIQQQYRHRLHKPSSNAASTKSADGK